MSVNSFARTASLARLAEAFSGANALGKAIRSLGGVAASWLDLAIRFWLAQAFLSRAAVSIVMHTPPTMMESNTWTHIANQFIASPVGVAIEATTPVFLLFGFLTRLAAIPLLVQAAFLKVADTNPSLPLFWTALLIWLLIRGPGPLSIDALMSGGLQSIAIPGASRVQRAFAEITLLFKPLYQALLRCWTAAVPLGAGAAAVGVMRPLLGAHDVPTWISALPAGVVSFPPGLSLALGAMLAAGFLSRACALVLLLAVPIGEVGMALDDRLYWALLLGIILLNGSGPLSVDDWLVGALARLERRLRRLPANLPHVVIVGGGFGGVAAARGLRNAPCRITLLDARNYHLFQPLLYQVATAGLSPADIATPIRSLFRDQDNLRVRLAAVRGVSPATAEVRLDQGAISFDYLVLATGSRHSYFGRDDWAGDAPGLKTIEDATAIRRRLLFAFEQAEEAEDTAERAACLSFVIVGGGPTGVELAGAIAELALHGLQREFREIDPSEARVFLVQSAPRLLPTFPVSLSMNAAVELTRLGVRVLTGSKVEHVDNQGAVVDGSLIPARTVIWAAGVAASPAGDWLSAPSDKAGRVIVGPDLAVAPHLNIFAIGDTAASRGWHGDFVPGLAPAAVQGGRYVAKVIDSRLRGVAAPGPFCYRHAGSLATIGRRAAVADFGSIRLRGALAWWVWGVVHILFLAGGRNRTAVAVDWAWAYLTGRRGSRLIVNQPVA